MAHTFVCRHCGSPIAFEDDERGFEVYCRSCGRANVSPPVNEVQPRRAASIFGGETVAPVDTVVGQQNCLCGATLPVRVDDLGESVYCPSCGTEILVGQTLLRRERGARLATGHLEEGNPKATALPQTRSRFARYLAAAAILAVAAGATLWWFRSPQTPMELMGRWADAVGLPVGPAKASPIGIAPEKKTKPARRAEVSLAMIDALAASPDPAIALVQARTWQKLLEKQGVAGDDKRRVRLAALVTQLEAKLAPPPERAPACVAEFQRHVEALAAALKSQELKAAGKAAQRAEEILVRHPQELAGHDHRFQLLKERLRREQEMGGDAVKIRTLLERARNLATQGKATEALEIQAEARFLAMTSALTPGEAARLDELDRRVTPEVRYARGRRAVDAACRFAARSDKMSRDQQAHSAVDLLSGLPEDRIRPLLVRILPFVTQKNTRGAAVRGNQAALEEIRRRRIYEEALEAYGRGQLVPLAAACRELEATAGGENSAENDLVLRCRQRLLEVLNWQIDQGEKTLHDAGMKAVAAALTDAREILQTSDFWREHPAYQELDRAIRRVQDQRQGDGSAEAKGARNP